MDVTVLGKDTADGALPPMGKVSDLETFGQDRHKYTGTDQKDQADGDPNKAVDLIVDSSKIGQKLVHKKTSQTQT